jgi:arylamine N-acetyltransferase
MDGKTAIIIKAVVIPLGFLILIFTITALFILKCRMDRKKDERENPNYSFAPYDQWQTPYQPDNQQWQAAQYSRNQWPMNKYPMTPAQIEKPVPVAYPKQYQSQLDWKSQA